MNTPPNTLLRYCPKNCLVSLCFLVLAVSQISCGVYSFKRTSGASLIETVSIAQFDNETIEPGVADRLTELVIDAIITEGTIDVVGPGAAEAILSGALKSYKRDPFTYDESDRVTQYVVKLRMEITLRKTSNDDEIWSEIFYNEGVYNADDETEEDGQTRAVSLLVTDILNKTSKGW